MSVDRREEEKKEYKKDKENKGLYYFQWVHAETRAFFTFLGSCIDRLYLVGF